MKQLLQISPQPTYFSFGYIPSGNFKIDLRGRLFGHVNLMKRLQAPDIFRTLNIQSGDRVLDFGCGMGFYTVEMAKLAKEAVGIDINPYVRTIAIPPQLVDRLKYFQVSGLQLPFADGYFDKVLASEILPMIPDPGQFLAEIKRVLKPRGTLVVVNGAGHPAIAALYKHQGLLFRILRKCSADRFPDTYEEYEKILQTSFATGQKRFLKETDLRELLAQHGFSHLQTACSPKRTAGAYFSWSQFLLYLATGKTLSQHGFLLKFVLFSAISCLEHSSYQGGLIISARNSA